MEESDIGVLTLEGHDGVTRWVPVSERLPNSLEKDVTSGFFWTVGLLQNGVSYSQPRLKRNSDLWYDVTHWLLVSFPPIENDRLEEEVTAEQEALGEELEEFFGGMD